MINVINRNQRAATVTEIRYRVELEVKGAGPGRNRQRDQGVSSPQGPLPFDLRFIRSTGRRRLGYIAKSQRQIHVIANWYKSRRRCSHRVMSPSGLGPTAMLPFL